MTASYGHKSGKESNRFYINVKYWGNILQNCNFGVPVNVIIPINITKATGLTSVYPLNRRSSLSSDAVVGDRGIEEISQPLTSSVES